jgi:hypothetical protein
VRDPLAVRPHRPRHRRVVDVHRGPRRPSCPPAAAGRAPACAPPSSSGATAICWLIFTMPHCRSASTTTTTGRSSRTAVSISCGCIPNAPSPVRTHTARPGRGDLRAEPLGHPRTEVTELERRHHRTGAPHLVEEVRPHGGVPAVEHPHGVVGEHRLAGARDVARVDAAVGALAQALGELGLGLGARLLQIVEPALAIGLPARLTAASAPSARPRALDRVGQRVEGEAGVRQQRHVHRAVEADQLLVDVDLDRALLARPAPVRCAYPTSRSPPRANRPPRPRPPRCAPGPPPRRAASAATTGGPRRSPTARPTR